MQHLIAITFTTNNRLTFQSLAQLCAQNGFDTESESGPYGGEAGEPMDITCHVPADFIAVALLELTRLKVIKSQDDLMIYRGDYNLSLTASVELDFTLANN